MEQTISRLNVILSATDNLTKPMEKATQSVRNVKNGLDKGTKSSGDFEKQSKKTSKSTDKMDNSFSKFANTLKRIVKLRIIRGIIREIVNAFKEGVQNVVKFDNAMSNVFGYNTAFSNISSAFTQLKNNLGVMSGNLVKALEPALVTVIQLFSKLVEKINAVSAMFSGKSSYLKANENYWSNYADSLDSANSSAKELKRTLFGFDELNVLSDNSSSSSTSDVTSMFTEQALPSWMQKVSEFFSKNSGLGNAIELLGLGSLLTLLNGSGGLNNVLKSLKGNVDNLTGSIASKSGEIANEALQTEADIVASQGLTNALGTTGLAGGVALLAGAFKDLNLDLPQLDTTPVTEPLTAMETSAESTMDKLRSNLGIYSYSAGSLMNRNLSKGLTSMAENFVSFAEGCDEAGASWATNMSTYASEAGNNMQDGFLTALTSMYNNCQSFGKALDSKVLGFWQANKETIKNSAITALGITATILSGGLIPAFADGGNPTTGTLFYAGESGAEIVSQSGNTTGVANVQQIAEATAQGNANVVSAVIQMANAVVNAINEKDSTTYLDGVRVSRAVNQHLKTINSYAGTSLVQGAK